MIDPTKAVLLYHNGYQWLCRLDGTTIVAGCSALTHQLGLPSDCKRIYVSLREKRDRRGMKKVTRGRRNSVKVARLWNHHSGASAILEYLGLDEQRSAYIEAVGV